MKIKCNDGVVREFSIAEPRIVPGGWINNDSLCLTCKKSFGVHDTKILKPLWKAHVCPQKA